MKGGTNSLNSLSGNVWMEQRKKKQQEKLEQQQKVTEEKKKEMEVERLDKKKRQVEALKMAMTVKKEERAADSIGGLASGDVGIRGSGNINVASKDSKTVLLVPAPVVSKPPRKNSMNDPHRGGTSASSSTSAVAATSLNHPHTRAKPTSSIGATTATSTKSGSRPRLHLAPRTKPVPKLEIDPHYQKDEKEEIPATESTKHKELGEKAHVIGAGVAGVAGADVATNNGSSDTGKATTTSLTTALEGMKVNKILSRPTDVESAAADVDAAVDGNPTDEVKDSSNGAQNDKSIVSNASHQIPSSSSTGQGKDHEGRRPKGRGGRGSRGGRGRGSKGYQGREPGVGRGRGPRGGGRRFQDDSQQKEKLDNSNGGSRVDPPQNAGKKEKKKTQWKSRGDGSVEFSRERSNSFQGRGRRGRGSSGRGSRGGGRGRDNDNGSSSKETKNEAQ